jgi:hypothetical protein
LTKVIQNTLKGLVLYNKCIKHRLAFVLDNSNLNKIKKPLCLDQSSFC